MKRILVIGGGMAGSIVANGLARKLNTELNNGTTEITVISATDKHLYQPGLLYLTFGRVTESELIRDQRSILDKRIKFHVDPATKIDADAKKVTTQSGKPHECDYMVIATGCIACTLPTGYVYIISDLSRTPCSPKKSCNIHVISIGATGHLCGALTFTTTFPPLNAFNVSLSFLAPSTE